MGRAIGMAMRGLKPVAEIQFFDYIWPAMMQIRDELATMRWRSNGEFACPAVMRVPIGGYLNGGAIYHSQCGEVGVHPHSRAARGVPLERPGCLRPDAHRAALRRPGAVPGAQAPLPRALQPLAASREDFTIPFGRAKVVKPGAESDRDHLRRAGAEGAAGRHAGGKAQARAPAIEIIDLRSLAPYDWEADRGVGARRPAA